MGWTGFAHHGRATIEILKKEVNGSTEAAEWTWLDQSRRGNTVYALVRCVPKAMGPHRDNGYIRDIDGGYRMLIVFLTQRRGAELLYKDITESMGPREKDCPSRLLDAASPLTDKAMYARDWRHACMLKAYEAKKAKQRKPKVGQWFKLSTPIEFRGGGKAQVFETLAINRGGRKVTLYKSPQIGGLLLRFNPLNYQFEIIDKPESV